jgi:hypothetical protein
MHAKPMDPHGAALLSYLAGDTAAALTLRRVIWSSFPGGIGSPPPARTSSLRWFASPHSFRI